MTELTFLIKLQLLNNILFTIELLLLTTNLNFKQTIIYKKNNLVYI